MLPFYYTLFQITSIAVAYVSEYGGGDREDCGGMTIMPSFTIIDKSMFVIFMSVDE
jgi:hypothetical protein